MAEKTLGAKTQTEIARTYGVSDPTVSRFTFESLSKEERRMYEEEMKILPYKSADVLIDSMAVAKQSLAEAMKEPKAAHGTMAMNMAKTAYEIHLRSTNQAVEIHEHRTPEVSARDALQRAIASGRFTKKQLPEVIGVIAKEYNVDRKVLED